MYTNYVEQMLCKPEPQLVTTITSLYDNDRVHLKQLLKEIKFECEKLSNGIHHFSSALKVVTWHCSSRTLVTRPGKGVIDEGELVPNSVPVFMPYYGLFWTESPYPDLQWRFRCEHYFFCDHIVDTTFFFHDPLRHHNR